MQPCMPAEWCHWVVHISIHCCVLQACMTAGNEGARSFSSAVNHVSILVLIVATGEAGFCKKTSTTCACLHCAHGKMNKARCQSCESQDKGRPGRMQLHVHNPLRAEILSPVLHGSGKEMPMLYWISAGHRTGLCCCELCYGDAELGNALHRECVQQGRRFDQPHSHGYVVACTMYYMTSSSPHGCS